MSTFNFNGNNKFGDNTKFIGGMNWIKITPETELPVNIPVLVKNVKYLIGRFGIAKDGYLFQDKDGFIFSIKELTHYAIWRKATHL